MNTTAPTITPDTRVTIFRTETIEFEQSLTVEDLEDYAGATLAEAGSVDELVERAKNRDSGFYDFLERHGDTTASETRVTVGDEPEPPAGYGPATGAHAYVGERDVVQLVTAPDEDDDAESRVCVCDNVTGEPMASLTAHADGLHVAYWDGEGKHVLAAVVPYDS